MNRASSGAPGFLSTGPALVSLRSRVHPKHKTRYRVRNRATCDRALAVRGDITLWLSPEAVAGWKLNQRAAGAARESSPASPSRHA